MIWAGTYPGILRAGCNSPPAVIARERLSAPNFWGSKGQQIRWNSEADGIVRMKENENEPWLWQFARTGVRLLMISLIQLRS